MNEPKQRHGCLTTWLVLLIAVNSLLALVLLVAHDAVARSMRSGFEWEVPVATIAAVANVVFAVALFQWKKWGFIGFTAVSLVSFVLNVSAGSGAQALFGLLGPLVLYAVLQIGGERKGWTQLD